MEFRIRKLSAMTAVRASEAEANGHLGNVCRCVTEGAGRRTKKTPLVR